MKSSKKKSNYLNLILTCSVIIMLCVSIFMVSLISAPSHMHDEINEEYDNISLDQIVSEEYFKDNPNKELELIFGDKNYRLAENSVEQLKAITDELYVPAQDAKIVFNPDNDEVFVFQDESVGQEVDISSLAHLIKDNLKNNRKGTIVIPTTAVQPNVVKKDLEGLTSVRSEFSTSIVNSQEGRKHNVGYALKAFNGLVVMPNEQISFNKTTGTRNYDDNYQDAIVILNGEYVQGKGGGVCQASTTLYNALIRAGLEINEVHNHSLPVKYVPLAFDAMVNDSNSDLVFTNTTGSPIYLMTGADDEKVWVKVFGAPLESGITIDTRSETIRDIDKGDKIVPDTEGKYADKISYKGEYLRVKYPQNGKECKGYLVFYKNGELVEEKEVRHVYYQGQEGIIMEGTDELPEGMTLPTNTVNFITGN